jgi:hypothetical protein
MIACVLKDTNTRESNLICEILHLAQAFAVSCSRQFARFVQVTLHQILLAPCSKSLAHKSSVAQDMVIRV